VRRRPRFLIGSVLLLLGGANLSAAVVGFFRSVEEAPSILGVGVCLVALGLWLRNSAARQ